MLSHTCPKRFEIVEKMKLVSDESGMFELHHEDHTDCLNNPKKLIEILSNMINQNVVLNR
jgi:hypothetical protein